jgi:hypothetical protein
VTKDPQRQLYLFPDGPATLSAFEHLRAGRVKTLRYGREHQDA